MQTYPLALSHQVSPSLQDCNPFNRQTHHYLLHWGNLRSRCGWVTRGEFIHECVSKCELTISYMYTYLFDLPVIVMHATYLFVRRSLTAAMPIVSPAHHWEWSVSPGTEQWTDLLGQ